MEKEKKYYATGKRKSAVARTWMVAGSGQISINNRPVDEYFKLEQAKAILTEPLILTNTQDAFDIKVWVKGGGITGQAGAIRHGITRALILADPDMRVALKRAGFVTRDSRIKERKKYGQRGARARYQFSKR